MLFECSIFASVFVLNAGNLTDQAETKLKIEKIMLISIMRANDLLNCHVNGLSETIHNYVAELFSAGRKPE